MASFIWSALVLGLLVSAIFNPEPREALSCNAGVPVIDANRDGQFTYTDVGAVALQAVALPLKFVRQRPEFAPLVSFFEIKPKDCSSPKVIILSGTLLLGIGVFIAWVVSIALLLVRHAAKYVLFDLFRVSPVDSINVNVFRHTYPKFIWLVPLSQVAFLCAGLTATLILKANPSKGLIEAKSPPRASQSKSIGPINSERAPSALAYVNVYQKHRAELSRLDAVAASVPSEVAVDVDVLTNFLVKDATSDLERTYLIYRWITSNIDYDVHAFRTKNLRGSGSASVVLKSRKAVCDGYAELFLRMAVSAGLRAEKLVGFAKGYGYSVGEPMKRPNHAWNAVQIDRQWYLLDSTWDAGSVDSDLQGFKQNKSDYNFFLTNPSHFIYTHFPENKRWQLLETPWSTDEFYTTVGATDKAFRMGLKVERHAASTIRVVSNQYEFDFATKNPLKASLRRDGKRVRGNWALAQFDESGRTRLIVTAPDRGSYLVNIFSSDQPQASVLEGLLEYRVVFEAPGQEFPETFGSYLSSKVALSAPLTGVLKANTSVAFNLTVPDAESVIINVNGQTVLTLEREGHRFIGEAGLAAGEAIIYAKFYGRQSYEGLLKYVVR